MEGPGQSDTTSAEDREGIDPDVLLTEMRARHMSRDAIIERLVAVGLTLDQATGAFEEDPPVHPARSDGEGLRTEQGGELPRLDSMPPLEHDPVIGIGGWLLIPAINLVVVIIGLVRNLGEGGELLDALDRQTAAAGLDRSAVVVGIAVFAALLALALLTAWCFVRRHRWTPRLYIALFVVGLVLASLAAIGAEADPEAEGSPPLGFLAAWSALWIVYFLRSKRVRNTFTG